MWKNWLSNNQLHTIPITNNKNKLGTFKPIRIFKCVYPRLAPFAPAAYFPALGTGCFFFSRFSPVVCFPALGADCTFSRGWRRCQLPSAGKHVTPYHLYVYQRFEFWLVHAPVFALPYFLHRISITTSKTWLQSYLLGVRREQHHLPLGREAVDNISVKQIHLRVFFRLRKKKEPFQQTPFYTRRAFRGITQMKITTTWWSQARLVTTWLL